MKHTIGLSQPASEYRPLRDCLQVGERTGSGNLIIRAGREVSYADGWEKIGHIVLTPAEVAKLIGQLAEALAGDDD